MDVVSTPADFEPAYYGARGDGVHDDAPALNAMIAEMAARYTTLPEGTYLGAGCARLGPHVYRCKSSVNMTPMVKANKNPSFHVSLRGEGPTSSVLLFDNGGLIGTDYHPGNFSSESSVFDLGVVNDDPKNETTSGIYYRGAADCHLDRVAVSGWRENITLIDVDQQTISRVKHLTSPRGVPAYPAGHPEGPRSIGVAMYGACNQVSVSDQQFNGPGLGILHAGGVGHFVRRCNSEGGILARVTDAHLVVHEGWTTEGMDETETPCLFHISDGGSKANVLAAVGVMIRESFFGGSTTRPVVHVDDQAVVTGFQWRRNQVAHAPSWGAIRLPYRSHLSGDVDVDAFGLPGKTPLFGMPPT